MCRYFPGTFRSALSNMRISDAQGSRIRVDDERVVTLAFIGHNGTPGQITEKFLVADVTSPLLATGKLICSGWELFITQVMAMPQAISAETFVPVCVSRNSLSAKAKAVTGVPEDRQQDYEEEFDSTAQVHMIVELRPVSQEVVNGESVGWVNVPDNYMVHIRYLRRFPRSDCSIHSGLHALQNYIVERDGLWHVEEEMNKFDMKNKMVLRDKTITFFLPILFGMEDFVAISQKHKIQQINNKGCWVH